VDAVLLSHLHHDHAELRSLRLVGAPVVTSASSARWLRSHHLDGRGIAGWSDLGPLEVRLVEAAHAGRPMPHRPNEATGHLLRHGTTTVWFAGDTSLYADMARLPALAGVPRLDVAVVPVGGWGPRLPIEHHMGPDEAARACALTEARYALPVHWGTLHLPLTRRLGDWFERPGEAFEAAARATAPGCQVVRLSVGESWSMPMPADDAGAS
jgi:L-ascorbate metabolism protein UlaG (beta-lactamase superfamily)